MLFEGLCVADLKHALAAAMPLDGRFRVTFLLG
jgi:hypothetical protein